MQARNNRAVKKAFVHPWQRYANELRSWVYQERRRRLVQKEIRQLESLCKAYEGDPTKASKLNRCRGRLEVLKRESEKIRLRIEAAIATFYPAVLASAESIVRLPYFKWLQIEAGELVSEWIIDLADHDFRGYDVRRPFFCYGLFLLRRTCANIARRESCRRCKPIPDDHGCEDDPFLFVQLTTEFDEVDPLFCKLPERVQDILTRKYCLEESSAEIAEAFNTTAAAIDRLTWQYRLIIRKQVAENRRKAKNEAENKRDAKNEADNENSMKAKNDGENKEKPNMQSSKKERAA